VLFLIIFLWTPPHFWALALYKQSPTTARPASRCCPMSPAKRATKVQILVYSVLLVASTHAAGLDRLHGADLHHRRGRHRRIGFLMVRLAFCFRTTDTMWR
jgi:heme O synthase-like polyprenyltransferase